jgi:hypothetical protein
MPTRRHFLSAIASLCAAAGLSRLAGGAAGAEPVKPVPAAPEGLTFTRTAVVTGLEPGEPVLRAAHLTFCVQWANVSELHAGKWRRPYRVVTFDERGRCVGVSRKMYAEVPARRVVEVSPELPEA